MNSREVAGSFFLQSRTGACDGGVVETKRVEAFLSCCREFGFGGRVGGEFGSGEETWLVFVSRMKTVVSAKE